jgi:hypothetical protein
LCVRLSNPLARCLACARLYWCMHIRRGGQSAARQPGPQHGLSQSARCSL